MTIQQLIDELNRIKAVEGPELPVYLWNVHTETPDLAWNPAIPAIEEDPHDQYNKPMPRGLVL